MYIFQENAAQILCNGYYVYSLVTVCVQPYSANRLLKSSMNSIRECYLGPLNCDKNAVTTVQCLSGYGLAFNCLQI
jgi:hypothetical protein